jgi:hypothetical protein
MSRMLALTLMTGCALAVGTGGAVAQTIGPPIPPDQILRQQNRLQPPPPTIPVPAQPSPPATSTQQTPMVPRGERDRASWCQHQATVERVPSGQRSSYIHHCRSP